jgi:hypothetical protein
MAKNITAGNKYCTRIDKEFPWIAPMPGRLFTVQIMNELKPSRALRQGCDKMDCSSMLKLHRTIALPENRAVAAWQVAPPASRWMPLRYQQVHGASLYYYAEMLMRVRCSDKPDSGAGHRLHRAAAIECR